MRLVKILFVLMILFCMVWLFFIRKKELWRKIVHHIEDCRDWTLLLPVCGILCIVEGGMVFTRTLPFVSDEVYSISGASFFAGYNWSSYMHLHKFYNFGYTMLLAPLYKLLTDPVDIYRAMLLVNVVLHVGLIVFVYHILNKQFKCSKLVSLAIALVSVCNSILLFFKGFVYNELPLTVIVWMVIWLLLKLVEAEGKKRIVLSAVLGVVTAYAYVIHSRCLIIFVALAITVICYLLVYKKWVMQPVSFALVFTACLMAEKSLVQYVQTHLYLNDPNVSMNNSVEKVATNTDKFGVLTSIDGIRKLILHFITLAGTLTVETGGILTIVTVAAIYYVVKHFKKYYKGEEKENLFLLTVFSFISLWGMVACIALTGADNGKYRFLLYSRYFTPFLGPFLLLGLFILKNKKELKWHIVAVWTTLITVMVCCAYIFYAFPMLKGQDMKTNASLYYFFAFVRYDKQKKFSISVIIIALGLLFIFSCIGLFLYKRKQFIALNMVVLIFSFALVWQIDEKQCQPASDRREQAVNATYEILKNTNYLEGKKLYCPGKEVYRKGVLVALYDEKIEFDTLEFYGNEDAVILTNDVNILSDYNVPYAYQLDSNEYIGVWDADLSARLSQVYIRYSFPLAE